MGKVNQSLATPTGLRFELAQIEGEREIRDAGMKF
jgi:hypothetical protein